MSDEADTPILELRQYAVKPGRRDDIWRRYREVVNDTLVDSDDVLLLRPAQPGVAKAQARRAGAAQLLKLAPTSRSALRAS